MQSPHSQVDLILSRFPGPVTLYPSRIKWLLVLLGCGLFTVAGLWIVSQGTPSGWFPLGFFGSGSVVAALMLLPGAGALTLDGDGFRVTSLFRSGSSRWQDVTGFESVSLPRSSQRLVGYDNINMAGWKLAKLNVAITGRNCALSDTYGLSADDLAWLMTLWRDRAVAA